MRSYRHNFPSCARSRCLPHLIHLIRLAPLFSPSFDTGGRAFSCLSFCGRCGSVVLAVCRAAASHRFPVSLLLPSGRFALPVRRPRVSCAYFVSSSCRSRRSYHLIAPRHVLSIRRAGSVERAVPVLAAGAVFSCPLDVVSSRPVLAGGASGLCLLRVRRVPLSPPVPFLMLSRYPFRFSSSFRPVLRHGGRGVALRRLSPVGFVVRSRCLPCVGCGVVSAWRVIISSRSRRWGVLCGLYGVPCCLPYRPAGRVSVFSSLVVFIMLACLAIPYRPPPRSIRQAGRGVVFLRSGGVGGAFPSVSRRRGFLARLCLLSYPCRRGGCLRYGRDGVRTGLGGRVRSVLLLAWRGRHSFGILARCSFSPYCASPHPDAMLFSLSSFPLRPTPSCGSSRFACLNCPPPPGAWDVRTGDRFAVAGGAVICLFLIVSLSCRVAHSACARSLSSCLRLGFSSRVSFFFLLAWSGLVACRRDPSSLRSVFAVPCVSCFVL